MQGLEKILEEIDAKIAESMGKKREGLLEADRIIRKNMNDGWIPVDDRDHMPDAGEHVLVSIGTGFNPEKAFLSEDGRWMMLHAPAGYNDITDEVEAWMPLPDSYRPERSVEE